MSEKEDEYATLLANYTKVKSDPLEKEDKEEEDTPRTRRSESKKKEFISFSQKQT